MKPARAACALVVAALAPAAFAAGAEQVALGRRLFTQDVQPSCALCHTLQDAGSAGAVGPVLDELKPDARRVADDIRRSVAAVPVPLGSGKSSVQITVSIGIAVASPADAVDAGSLYQQADQALYLAKQAGRNRVRLFGSPEPAAEQTRG